MESRKNSNPTKLVAFFLVVAVLIAAIAFSASGWQGEQLGKPDSGNSVTDKNEPVNGDADENTDGSGGEGEKNETPAEPAYTHYITGLEISKDESFLKPLCIVFDTEAPMYGISSSFLTVELPIEGGKTRLLAFSNDATSQGKLGSIAPTRKYISNVARYFGAILVSSGNDDSFAYSGFDTIDTGIDFTAESGYHYTEYGKYAYTNADLLTAYIKTNGISTVKGTEINMPYLFTSDTNGTGDENEAQISADTVLITFDKGSTTELVFSDSDGKYRMKKNSSTVTDRINEREILYDNAFILYADSLTHETSEATQLIMDTAGGGTGFYMAGGEAVRISWYADDSGALHFTTEDGKPLCITPGISYIAFAKVSQINNTKLN